MYYSWPKEFLEAGKRRLWQTDFTYLRAIGWGW
jgi:hypothetical protein